MPTINVVAQYNGWTCEFEVVEPTRDGFTVVVGYDHRMSPIVGWVSTSQVLETVVESAPVDLCVDDDEPEAVVLF